MAVKAAGGLRFHDLRHGYATWLISSGVPVNAVQAAMGPEQASTTLNCYTHTPADFHRLIRGDKHQYNEAGLEGKEPRDVHGN